MVDIGNAWGDKPAVAGTAAEIAQALPASAWQHLSAGEGTKGPRRHDWAYLELTDQIGRASCRERVSSPV